MDYGANVQYVGVNSSAMISSRLYIVTRSTSSTLSASSSGFVRDKTAVRCAESKLQTFEDQKCDARYTDLKYMRDLPDKFLRYNYCLS